MQIFRIDADPKTQTLTTGGSSLLPKVGGPAYGDPNALRPMLAYRLVPFRREGDFRGVADFFSCQQAVLERVLPSLRADVQVLPFTVDDQEEPSFLLYPVNVLDAADVPAVKQREAAQGNWWPPCYEFRREVFARPQLFTVPLFDTAIFYATELGSTELDFYVRYHELELTGLTFKQVWQN